MSSVPAFAVWPCAADSVRKLTGAPVGWRTSTTNGGADALGWVLPLRFLDLARAGAGPTARAVQTNTATARKRLWAIVRAGCGIGRGGWGRRGAAPNPRSDQAR